MTSGTLTDLTAHASTRFGAREALLLPGEARFNFIELNEKVAYFSGGLAALGVSPGDRVLLHLPNGWRWIVAYHAIARLGAVVVPANILLSPGEVIFLQQDSEASVSIIPCERRADLAGLEGRIVGAGVGRDNDQFEVLLKGEALPPAVRSPSDLFTIGYTSGTTGRPKGAMLTHGNIYASLAATATMHVRHAGDTVLSSLPFPHVYGNIVMNAMFLAGTRLVTTPRFDAGEALRQIEEYQVTLFEGVPTMYYQMLAHAGCATADLSSLTRCTVGGQTMPTAKIEQVARRFGCPMLELWGMTEVAGPAVTHSPYWPSRYGSIGRPVPGVEIRVADLDDSNRDAPAGVPGELLVRGDLVTKGYWKNPQATSAAIDDGGWLATGDIGRVDADGYLTVVDRKKDLIITAGYNVYPAELEQVLATHPDIAMVAVAGIEDAEKGELAYAFVVRHAERSASEAEILAHCRKTLAAYKVPRRVIFVDDLPKTSTGKIMRRTLREMLEKMPVTVN